VLQEESIQQRGATEDAKAKEVAVAVLAVVGGERGGTTSPSFETLHHERTPAAAAGAGGAILRATISAISAGLTTIMKTK